MPLGWWEEEPTHCLCLLPSTHDLYVLGEVPTVIWGPREQRHWGMGDGGPSFVLRGCACSLARYPGWAVLPEFGSEAFCLKPSAARAAVCLATQGQAPEGRQGGPWAFPPQGPALWGCRVSPLPKTQRPALSWCKSEHSEE